MVDFNLFYLINFDSNKEGKMDKLNRLFVQQEIFDKILEGLSRKEIIKEVCLTHNIGKEYAIKLYYRAYNELKEVRSQKAGTTISLHVERYEYLYRKAMNWGLDMLAMKILKQKEELLQLVRNGESISVELNTNVLVLGTDTHDFSRATDEERDRFASIMSKIGLMDDRNKQLRG